MAGRLHAVALAVAGVINAADPAFEVSAEVAWLPVLKRAEAAGPELLVVPIRHEPAPESRGSVEYECRVAVVLLRPTVVEAQITSDVLMLETIGDRLYSKTCRTLDTAAGRAVLKSAALEEPVDLESWRTLNQYRGLLMATYRISGSVA